MKLLLYIVGGFVTLALAVLVITRGQAAEGHPLMLYALTILFAVPALGAFWMMYVSVRYEKKPFALLLLALLVPFSFIWYYFERIRPGKLSRNRNLA